MTKAWHLRQDGKAFPVKVHIYCMGDEDLSSEAEAAAFIINTNSKDQELAEYVLDAWMALLIEQEVPYDADTEEDIDKAIIESISSLPYHLQYPLSPAKLLSIHKKLKNYTDIDSLYEFVDKVKEDIVKIQKDIKISLNQQFCRVRYGGQYNSVSGNSEIWFRISSANYNWADTIYVFVSTIKRAYNLSHITICRDNESDEREVDYFYKAKDGTLYKNMPIDEYYEEEHEHNPVFESLNINEGILCFSRKSLSNGDTYKEVEQKLCISGVVDRLYETVFKYLVRREVSSQCVSGEKSTTKIDRRSRFNKI